MKRGFTLIEVLLALSFLGVVLLYTLHTYSFWSLERGQRNELKAKLEYIDDVISIYIQAKGSFPCGGDIWDNVRYYGYRPAPVRGFGNFTAKCFGSDLSAPDAIYVVVCANNIASGDFRAVSLDKLKRAYGTPKTRLGTAEQQDNCSCVDDMCSRLSCTTSNLCLTYYIYKKDWLQP